MFINCLRTNFVFQDVSFDNIQSEQQLRLRRNLVVVVDDDDDDDDDDGTLFMCQLKI